MKYERAVTAKQILEYLKSINIAVTYSGDETVIVSGFSSLGYYREGNITWIKKDDNVPPNLDLSKINLVIIQEGVQASCKNTIITAESKRAFFAILEQFFTDTSKQPPIGSYTVIGKNVKVGQRPENTKDKKDWGISVVGDNLHIGVGANILPKQMIDQDIPEVLQ